MSPVGLPGTISMLDERLRACDVGFAGRRGIDPAACVPRVSCGRSTSARGSVYASRMRGFWHSSFTLVMRKAVCVSLKRQLLLKRHSSLNNSSRYRYPYDSSRYVLCPVCIPAPPGVFTSIHTTPSYRFAVERPLLNRPPCALAAMRALPVCMPVAQYIFSYLQAFWSTYASRSPRIDRTALFRGWNVE